MYSQVPVIYFKPQVNYERDPKNFRYDDDDAVYLFTNIDARFIRQRLEQELSQQLDNRLTSLSLLIYKLISLRKIGHSEEQL